MSQSLANIVVHLVFSTKDRRQLLRDEERGQVHAYITGILKKLDSPLIEINSVRDTFTSCSPNPRITRPRRLSNR
jgi:REP element-mobilizing transposase RayT